MRIRIKPNRRGSEYLHGTPDALATGVQREYRLSSSPPLGDPAIPESYGCHSHASADGAMESHRIVVAVRNPDINRTISARSILCSENSIDFQNGSNNFLTSF
jgi:hypothetical protein